MGFVKAIPETEKMRLLLEALKNAYNMQQHPSGTFDDFVLTLLKDGKDGYKQGTELEKALAGQDYIHYYNRYTIAGKDAGGEQWISIDKWFGDDFIKQAAQLNKEQLTRVKNVVAQYSQVRTEIEKEFPLIDQDATTAPYEMLETANKREDALREAGKKADGELKTIFTETGIKPEKDKRSSAISDLPEDALERIASAQQQFNRAQQSTETSTPAQKQPVSTGRGV